MKRNMELFTLILVSLILFVVIIIFIRLKEAKRICNNFYPDAPILECIVSDRYTHPGRQ